MERETTPFCNFLFFTRIDTNRRIGAARFILSFIFPRTHPICEERPLEQEVLMSTPATQKNRVSARPKQRRSWRRIATDTQGSVSMEYALIGVLVSLVIIAGLAGIGDALKAFFASVAAGF